ncbi:hypothetical protein PENTCL1PPCAC_12601, partial [Pristionchus entomophagus]
FIGSLFRSKLSQACLAISLLAGVYLLAIGRFSDTNALQWRRGHFYGAYFVDDRRLQSIDEGPTVTPSLADNDEGVNKRPSSRRKMISARNRSRLAKLQPDQTTSTTHYRNPHANIDLQINNTETSDTIYFRTAAVITMPRGGIGLRITSLQECGNKRTTKLRIGELEISLRKATVHKSCPWFFAPHCRLVGYYATGTITSNAEQTVPLPPRLPDFAEIYDNRRDLWKPIDLIDGRSAPAHAHRLAVCLQPMYLMADWPLIPNFFETWIGNGATIFYIYVHSISEEVDLMIRLYEAQRDVEVVRVNWPAVPTAKADDDDHNPNNRMYRTEVGTAVNDCILRARATADLVVSSDLDEIIAPLNLNGNKETLFNIIEDHRLIQTRKLKNGMLPGAFLFRQSFAYAENDWFSISHPSQLSFDHYKAVDYETFVWQRGYRSKVIYVPDRVFRAHVHDVVAFEGRRWTTVVIDPDRARVLHFRQVKNKYMQRENVTADSQVLAAAAACWQAAYAARLDAVAESETGNLLLRGAFNLTFARPEWPNLGEQVLSEIESCRDRNDEIKKDKCVTEWRCRSTMEALRPGQWVEPDGQAWTVI